MAQTISTFSKRIPPGVAGAGTLQALMERQQQAARQKEAAGAMPGPISSPWQGAAHIGNIVAAGINEGRASRQQDEARQALAQIVAGVDPAVGASKEQLAEMEYIDPQLAKQYRDEAFAARRAADERKYQTGERVAGQDFQITKLGEEDKIADTNRTQEDVIGDANATRDAEIAKKQADYEAGIARKNAEVEQRIKTDAIGTDTAAGITAREEAAKKLGLVPGTLEYKRYVGVNEIAPPADVNPADAFTPGQAEMDKKFAPEVLDYDTGGGANAEKAIAQVNEGIRLLESGDVTGLMAGIADNLLPPVLSKWANPEGNIARDAIRETVQQTMRQALGAQFTQVEGEQLMNRAFDIDYGTTENLRRAKLLLRQIQTTAKNREAMIKHYKANKGTLAGYVGPSYDTSSLVNLDFGGEGGGGGGGGSSDIDAMIEEANQ